MKKLLFLSTVFLQSCVDFYVHPDNDTMVVTEITITSRYTAEYEIDIRDGNTLIKNFMIVDTIGKYDIGEAITFTKAPKSLN